jgi:hypothetical protein
VLKVPATLDSDLLTLKQNRKKKKIISGCGIGYLGTENRQSAYKCMTIGFKLSRYSALNLVDDAGGSSTDSVAPGPLSRFLELGRAATR